MAASASSRLGRLGLIFLYLEAEWWQTKWREIRLLWPWCSHSILPPRLLLCIFCPRLSQQSGLIYQCHSKEGWTIKYRMYSTYTTACVSASSLSTLPLTHTDEGKRPLCSMCAFCVLMHVVVHVCIQACVGASGKCWWCHLNASWRCALKLAWWDEQADAHIIFCIWTICINGWGDALIMPAPFSLHLWPICVCLLLSVEWLLNLYCFYKQSFNFKSNHPTLLGKQFLFYFVLLFLAGQCLL